MIPLTHTVSGSQIGDALADDEEEIAFALAAIAARGVDEQAVADYIMDDDRTKVRDLCNAIAASLADN